MDGLSHSDISMETLQTSIVNAIKAIRSSKKRIRNVCELTVYKFVKKELHLITSTDVNNTLKILIEMGRIENKPSKDKSSYFLSENRITDSEHHIPTIMATPLVKASLFTDILSPSIEDQINSFVSSDTENDNNNSLETLEVIDNSYKYAKYKKIQDVLLPEIKKCCKGFYTKRSKTKLLNNDILQNKSCNIVGETWDFDVPHETSDSESMCNISNSEDSIVESRDVNTINNKISSMSISDQ